MNNPAVEIKYNTESVVNEFISFYYNALNSQDLSSLQNMYKEWSEVMVNGTLYKGTNIQILFELMSKQRPVFHVEQIDFLLCGARRVNILVHGQIQTDDSVTNFTEYIHLGSLKNGFWIQSSILRS